MEITVRGWSRNMGARTIADYDLSAMRISNDAQKTVYFDRPGLFKSHGEVSVAWGCGLHLTGDYRVQVSFTRSDVIKLFKAMFGSVLDTTLLDEYGFAITPDLQKRLISQIKLADLTIGDLAGLGSSQEKREVKDEEIPATIKSFKRRF